MFADWTSLDRFGLVVTEPLGGLGAALLLQPGSRDFWPPRKEVRVPAGQPRALLEAVNAHDITCLVLPLGEPDDVGADSELGAGSSTWAEQASALALLLPVLGRRGRPLSSTDPRMREDVAAPLGAGRPCTVADGLRWADMVDQCADEIPQPVRERAVATHAARLHAQADRFVEVYRRITADEALARIAGMR
ncbi:hypothetical protein ACF1HJ_33600 [Streptomyces sp. NPDC013978]|uniref:hypothetical protein n=1 Tax=Streptomyces sp. NPDC013978 TaxID=3364869 RepID=UPI0037018BA4